MNLIFVCKKCGFTFDENADVWLPLVRCSKTLLSVWCLPWLSLSLWCVFCIFVFKWCQTLFLLHTVDLMFFSTVFMCRAVTALSGHDRHTAGKCVCVNTHQSRTHVLLKINKSAPGNMLKILFWGRKLTSYNWRRADHRVYCTNCLRTSCWLSTGKKESVSHTQVSIALSVCPCLFLSLCLSVTRGPVGGD